MTKHLVIVESPAKARTLKKFLGDDFMVESSIGHVRDLPSRAAEIPPAHRGKSWSRIGVNVEDGFKPLYIVPAEKKSQVKKLKELIKKADMVFLATDEDREGEAIAWHLMEVLKPTVPVKRMVFHEITEHAILNALEQPRNLDARLVQAQEARRILDRLFGYEVSPVLWKKIRPRLSAGRVQSVATRLVVERERARLAFKSGEYWSVQARLITPEGRGRPERVMSELIEMAGRRLALGRDFDSSTGELAPEAIAKNVIRLDRQAAEAIEHGLADTEFQVESVTKKPFTQKPAAPFITSTLQQEAGRKLSYSAQRTMRVAQRLYENGYITYMRTDATTLSEQALTAARSQIAEMYGSDFLPEQPRQYVSKVKGAQEAHEAIRPAGESFRKPEQLQNELDQESFRLYELIWKRTMASQMKDARGERSRIRFEAALPDQTTRQLPVEIGGRALFQATGKVITFPGFLRAYVEGTDDPEAELGDKEVLLPDLQEKDKLMPAGLESAGHETKPPARFTEASLVHEMEQLGIGRPSTYASTIQTIQDRGYVFKRSGALIPTLTAFAVTRLMENHFGELVDYGFTARMESDLDAICSGELNAEPWLKTFYFGEGKPADTRHATLADVGIKAKIEHSISDIDARQVCAFELGQNNGEVVAARVGRYGAYLQIGEGESRASIPEETPLDELDVNQALKLIKGAKEANRFLGHHPGTGESVWLKSGRYGPYVQLGENGTNGQRKRVKPKMASLWPDMAPTTVALDDAVRLLSYPRVLGRHPENGSEIHVDFGQYGPYIHMEVDGKRDSRSLENYEELKTIDLDKAVALFAEPKKRRRRGQGAGSVASLGVSPVTGREIQVRSGRFGPYVTDGQINASIRAGRDPASLTFDDALELIAAREQHMRDQGVDPRAEKPSSARRKSSGRMAAKGATDETAKVPAGKKRAGAASRKGSPEKHKSTEKAKTPARKKRAGAATRKGPHKVRKPVETSEKP